MELEEHNQALNPLNENIQSFKTLLKTWIDIVFDVDHHPPLVWNILINILNCAAAAARENTGLNKKTIFSQNKFVY